MRILLIEQEKIYRINLSSNDEGTYWIEDNFGKKILKITVYDGQFQIVSDNCVQIIKPKFIEVDENNKFIVEKSEKTIAQEVFLKKNGMYAICLGDSNFLSFICCLDESEERFKYFDIIDTAEITVGYSDDNDIVYQNFFTSDYHASIFYENGNWFIEDLSNNSTTFINDTVLNNEVKQLKIGDSIFIMGLKIIFINNSFYINQPNNLTIHENNLDIKPIKKLNIIDNVKSSNMDNDIKIDYYSKSPRMLNLIEREEIKVEEPPTPQKKSDRPTALVLASSLSMGLISVLFTFMILRNMSSGSASTTVIYIIIALVTFAAMIVIPIINNRYEKKSKEDYETKRIQRYTGYLDKKSNLIANIREKQRNILYKNYLSPKECQDIILSNDHRLWERKIEDDDFLSIRLGIGTVPLDIKILYPEEKFKMEDDALLDLLNEMIKNSKTIDDAPIGISLRENNIIAFISKDKNLSKKYIENIILQLITFHSYDDMKLVFFVNNNQKQWDYVKMLPHVWDDFKQVRFFADNDDDMNQISQYLSEELKIRLSKNDDDIKYIKPYYVIITDSYRRLEDYGFIRDFLKNDINLGFSLICIDDDLYQLPNKSNLFVTLEDENGILFNNQNPTENEKNFKLDIENNILFTQLVQKLANIQIRINNKNITHISNVYSFLEMYNVGTIEKLDVKDRWKRNDTTLSLKAPIGIDGNGMPIFLDIHEKYHGPHGLIAGSTGSGKSELIITYILSLAINYHPNDVNFLLIDYKGGGLTGAFEQNGIRLPHIIGTITNLNTNDLRRSLVSINSELKRRQIIFNNVKNMTNEGTIDIYKYQRLYHNGKIKEPLPHLIIICDEFAELKQQQSEFMDELISISRIGRSLGIHLILSTQKPAGIVNDQIRGNSRFAICLKVQDKTDSTDVIKTDDAAFLKTVGQFYLQVGNNEYFVLGQSAWSGAPYIPSQTVAQNIDTSVEFVSNIGYVTKRVDNVSGQFPNQNGEQLLNIVKYLCDLAKEEKIKTKNLWLSKIPNNIYLKDLKQKYNTKKQGETIEAIVGEYDNPEEQDQGLVKLNFSQRNNIAIYGNAESGKETFLSTMIYDLINSYNVEQIQFYILDFGSEALKIYKKSSHIGEVICTGEDEKVERFFEMINQEIKDRKNILSNYNGDYNVYIKDNNNIMPIWTIIINNFEAFQENYNMLYDDVILTMSRDALKCGILFVITLSSSNGMRYRLKQNFNQKITLQLNTDDEYFSIYERKIDSKPEHIFGRGLIQLEKNDKLVEFQTAKVCDASEYNFYIEKAIDETNSKATSKAKPIVTMPDVLEIADIQDSLTDITNVPIGMKKKDLEICTYDFKENFATIIVAKNMNNAIDFVEHIFEAVKTIKNIDTVILDPEQIKEGKQKTPKEIFNNFIKNLDANVNKKSSKFTLVEIIGIDKFMAEGAIDKIKLDNLFKKAKSSKSYSFLIVDNPVHLKNHSFEDWYTNYINKDCGIWIGNGISDQHLIQTNLGVFSTETKCDLSFGFLIKDKETTLIKLLGMKAEDES